MRSEFDFIHHIKGKYALKYVGDDCAVLPKDDKTDMVITADMLVEDIDFRLEWTTAEQLGHKALTVSLSDIAAMGAVPTWAMLSIGAPQTLWETDFLDRFYSGYHSHAKRSQVELVGGDVSRTPAKLVIDSIVGGEVPRGRAILRSGAKVGDAIVVTSRLGGSAGGLKLLKSGRRSNDSLASWEENLLHAHLKPWPQMGSGPYLRDLQIVNAMIDISDGFASDLKHVCIASNVGARLIAADIPIDPNLRNLSDSFDEQLDLALNGGEDFQLLFTLSKDNVSKLSAGFIDGPDHGLFSVVGEITSNAGIIELVRDDRSEILEPKGYRHF